MMSSIAGLANHTSVCHRSVDLAKHATASSCHWKFLAHKQRTHLFGCWQGAGQAVQPIAGEATQIPLDVRVHICAAQVAPKHDAANTGRGAHCQLRCSTVLVKHPVAVSNNGGSAASRSNRWPDSDHSCKQHTTPSHLVATWSCLAACYRG